VTESDASDVRAVLSDQARVARRVLDTLDALAPADVRLIGHVLHHYDGPPFTGLAPGQLGEHGLLTRSETLVFADAILDEAYAELRPQALGGSGSPPAGAPPDAFDGLGYRRETAGSVFVDGWYADTTSNAYDTQLSTPSAPIPRRGLVLTQRDPRGYETHITPDPYWLLPARVRDAAGLETAATYDYRAGRPRQVTDPNVTVTTVIYQPTGLVAAIVVVASDGRGDTPERPGTSYRYDLDAFRSRGWPISVQTRRRVWHASDAVSDEVVEAREYSDGFGRLLQTRTQSDDLAFGPMGDDSGLREAGAAGPAVGARQADRVVVSGWHVYDNKGRVVQAYEPFFDRGWDFQPDAKSRRGKREVKFYDPRGEPVRVLNADGSQRLVVRGIPSRLDDPAAVDPTPWSATAYDENDLAPLSTRPDGSSLSEVVAAEQHFTPTTTVVDALERPVCALARGGTLPESWHLTRTTYDVRGNVLTVVDEMARTAFSHTYDWTNRPLRVRGMDTGRRITILDAGGNRVLSRDDRGAITFRTFDALGRPTTVHARETAAAPLTLRERITYGDALAPGPERDAAVAARGLGRVVAHDDEAGRLRVGAYDEAGRVLSKTRTVISDDALAAGWRPDWAATSAEAALEPTASTTRHRFDALGRAVEVRAPDGRTVTISYARSGALTSVAVDGRSFVSVVAHNARGQRVLIAHGNGLLTRYAYDPDTFRLRRLRTEPASPAGDTWSSTGAPLQDLTYSHDLVGNVTGIEERVQGCGVAGTLAGRDALVRSFGYDGFYRLVSATGRADAGSAVARSLSDDRRSGAVTAPFSGGPASPSQANGPDLTTTYAETYRYDEVGSLLDLRYRPTSGPVSTAWHRLFGISGRDPGDSAGAPDNHLTAVQNPGGSPLTLTYDEAGNLLTEGATRSYGWDYANRLVEFTVRNGKGVSVHARYLYDTDGRRVKKWVRYGGTATADESRVYVDGLSERHRWAAGSGGENHVLNLLDGNKRIATARVGDRHPDDLGPPIRFELGDHLGSVALITDDTGAWTNREEYFAYGETSFGSFARKRYRFTGRERDEESGLTYHGARYYAPVLARWVSPDPEGPREGSNAYVYSAGRPVVLVDIAGRAPAAPEVHAKDQDAGTTTSQALTQPKADNLGPVLRAATTPLEINPAETVDLDKIKEWVRVEEPPPVWSFWTTDDKSERHRYQVLRVVEFFVQQANDQEARKPVEQRATHFGILYSAKEKLTTLRQSTTLPRASESLILRDAQRYLWGRVGIEQNIREHSAPRVFTETVGPELVYDYYEILKTMLRPVNALGKKLGLDLDLAQSTSAPLAAKGGSDWFGLGLEHFWVLDRSELRDKTFVTAPRYFANEPIEDW
jgi:RHS repeat-associated protein